MTKEENSVPVWLAKLADECGAYVAVDPEGMGWDVEINGYSGNFADAADAYWYIKLVLEKGDEG